MEQSKAFAVEMHAELPAMMTVFHEEFKFERDALSYSATVKACLNAQKSPVFYVLDLTKWHYMSFDEIMAAASQAALGRETNFHHPMNRYTLVITNDYVLQASLSGMTHERYGNARIKLFGSVADALDYVKSEI